MDRLILRAKGKRKNWYNRKEKYDDILAGKVQGRVVVDVNV